MLSNKLTGSVRSEGQAFDASPKRWANSSMLQTL